MTEGDQFDVGVIRKTMSALYGAIGTTRRDGKPLGFKPSGSCC